MPYDLAGKPIVITGAGSGIGKATALACAQAGMPVALAGRRAPLLDEVCTEITKAGSQAIVVPTDVADPAQAQALIRATVQAFGSVYAVFANAGYGLRGEVHKLPDKAIRDIFETNFFGSLNVLRPALEYMLERTNSSAKSMRVRCRAGLPIAPQGHLLMCASCLSKIGTPYTAPYSASKALQDHFGRAMRHELGPKGIAVSTVHPIGTRTPFFATAAGRSAEDATDNLSAPRLFTQSPQRVANAVVRCLGKPRGEVWTSLPVRVALAFATACPRSADRLIARRLRKKNSD